MMMVIKKILFYLFVAFIFFFTAFQFVAGQSQFSETDMTVRITPEQSRTIEVIVYELTPIKTVHLQKKTHPQHQNPSHIKSIETSKIDDFSYLVSIEVYSPHGVRGIHRELIILNNQETLNVKVITTHNVFVKISDFLNFNVRIINNYYSMKVILVILLTLFLLTYLIFTVRRFFV